VSTTTIVIIILVIVALGFAFRYAKKENASPVVRTKARAIDEECDPFLLGNLMTTGVTEDCYLIYQLDSGETVRLLVKEEIYKNAEKNKWGELTFQGGQFIKFEVSPDAENDGGEPVTDPTAQTTEEEVFPSDKATDQYYEEGLDGLRKSGLLTEKEYRDMVEKHKKGAS